MTTRKKKSVTTRAGRAHRQRPRADETTVGDIREMSLRLPGSAVLTGGDVDADREHAWDSGEEAVGGSVSTPDQDVVDELGRALGVEQEPDAEVKTSGEILRERDRHRWNQQKEDDA